MAWKHDLDELMVAKVVQRYLVKLAAEQKAGAIVVLDELMVAKVAEMAAWGLDSIVMLVLVNRS